MTLLDVVTNNLPDGRVTQVCIGLHWTAVVVENDSGRACGLATTLIPTGEHHGSADVPDAGQLTEKYAHEIIKTFGNVSDVMNSVAIATINAVLPQTPSLWVDKNAEEVIGRNGKEKKVVIVGSFPFVDRLREKVGELVVIEKTPKPGEISAERAPEFIPSADVVAITGMTIINQTFEPLLKLCSPKATVLVLGPSTPLCPELFKYGVHLLSGSIVTNIDSVVKAAGQGANFRQLHKIGVRLVTISTQ
jgi:uncharacterized protein (DUF4213/DUF364 family)